MHITPRLCLLHWLNTQLAGAMHAQLRRPGVLGLAAARLPAGSAAAAPAARGPLQLKEAQLAFSSASGSNLWWRTLVGMRPSAGLARSQPAQLHASQRRLVAASAGDAAGDAAEARTPAVAALHASVQQHSTSVVAHEEAVAAEQDDPPAEASGSGDSQAAHADTDASGSPGEVAHPEPPPLSQDLASCWAMFLSVLHDRGFFMDSHPATHIALQDKRNVKKALQQLGRQRPDALFALPPAPLRTLAAAGLPEGMPPERKSTAAAERLQRSFIEGAAGDKQGASLQDVLRVMSAWARPTTESDAEIAVLQTAVPKDLQQAIRALLSATLTATTAPPKPAAMARARAATATPDIGALEAWADRKAQGAGGPEAAGAVAGRRGAKYTARQTVNHGLADAHKQRLARAVANKLRLVKGDWFCGDCGTRNFKSAQACVRCGVPSSSLGCSVVSARDIKELESQGLLQPMSSARDAEGAAGEQAGGGPAEQFNDEDDGVRHGLDGRIKKPRWKWSERSDRRSRDAQSRGREDMDGPAERAEDGSREQQSSHSSHPAASRHSYDRSSSSRSAGPGSEEDQSWSSTSRGSRRYEQRGQSGSSRGGRGGREWWGRKRSSDDGSSSEGQQRWGAPAGTAGRQYEQSSYGESSHEGRGGRFGQGRDVSNGKRSSRRGASSTGNRGDDGWGSSRGDIPKGQWSRGRSDRSMADAGPSSSSELEFSGQWSEVREGARRASDASTSSRARLFSRNDDASASSTRRGRGQAGTSWYDAEPLDRSDAAEAELARLVEQGDGGKRAADRSRGRSDGRGRVRGRAGPRSRSDGGRFGRGGDRGLADDGR